MCWFSRKPEPDHPDLSAEKRRLRQAQIELARTRRATPRTQELGWDVGRHRRENNLSKILGDLFVTPKDK